MAKKQKNNSFATNFNKYFYKLLKNKKLMQNLAKFSLLLGLISISLLFFKQAFSFFLTLLIVTIASFSKTYKRVLGFSIGFELVTFSAIIFFYTHGFVYGIILTYLMLSISTLLSGHFNLPVFLQFALYALVGLLIITLNPLGIVVAGKIVVIAYNLIFHTITIFLLGMSFHRSVINFTVNIITNIILLESIAIYLVGVL